MEAANKPELKEATEGEKRSVEIDKMMAEIYKIGAETGKINREARWYPLVALAAFITSLWAVFKVFHG